MRCPKRSTHTKTGADVTSARLETPPPDHFEEFAERSADLKTLRAMLEQAKQHADTCQKALVQAQEDVYKARLQCRGLAYAVERLERDLKGSAP